MHYTKWSFFLCHLGLVVAGPKPNVETPTVTSRSVPDIVKRINLPPSAYPYGNELVNEFQWHGWDPTDGTQRADAEKIHNAYTDMLEMVNLAWNEADGKTDSFKRWFAESDADNVKKVLERIVDISTHRPTALMATWVCEQTDYSNRCGGKTNAYTTPSKGIFHYCPYGLQKANTRDLTCDKLDGYASAKMRSVGMTMMHESMHWREIGDAALGQHITDLGKGASACFGLSAGDKLLNAQNYAFLGGEAYYKAKGCTFTDPPPGTSDTDDYDDQVADGPDYSTATSSVPSPKETKSTASSVPSPKETKSTAPSSLKKSGSPSNPTSTPAPYNPGQCCFHMYEYELPCISDTQNLVASLELKDDKKQTIGKTDIPDDQLGVHIDAGNSYHFKSKLNHELVITGEHQGDFVQFTVGDISWKSDQANGGAHCDQGGWDPRGGAVCGRISTKSTRQMDCCFPCDGKL